MIFIGCWINGTPWPLKLRPDGMYDTDHVVVGLTLEGQPWWQDSKNPDKGGILHIGEEVACPGNVFVCAFRNEMDRDTWFNAKVEEHREAPDQDYLIDLAASYQSYGHKAQA